MTWAWVVVGVEVSGDEDETFPPQAFGFKTWAVAQQWIETALTFEGRVIRASADVLWLLDRLGVDIQEPG